MTRQEFMDLFFSVGRVGLMEPPTAKTVTITFKSEPSWALCDGRWLSVVDYPELFAVVGTYYGFDTIKNKFRLPDYTGYMKDEFMAGANESVVTFIKLAPDNLGAMINLRVGPDNVEVAV